MSRALACHPVENASLRTRVAGRNAVTVSVSSPQGVMLDRWAVPTFTASVGFPGADVR
jgi:hypothetical protein